ncbi:hypothetical protein AB1Y20_013434 [Prymnesium parvum]|uniref:aspartate--tRNA ligase n=1 Tax=Prymnesium parvum TaxID=97485 RepID=A0AB34II90_PRYPA
MEASRSSRAAYLSRHNVEPKLNDVLNELIGELPADPLGWVADRLASEPGAPTLPSRGEASEDFAAIASRWACALAFQGAAAEGAASPAPAAPASPPAAAPEGGGEAKDAKKVAKAEEKRRKEEEKERKRKEREEAERKKLAGPEVPELTLLDFLSHEFGQLHIQSHCKTDRTFSQVSELSAEMKGQSVWLRVRLQNSRKQSAKLGFLVLRQRLATVQTVVQGKDMTSFVCGLPNESVIDVLAEVNVPPAPINSCSVTGVELAAKRVYCLTKAATRLPLQLQDASRSDKELQELGLPRVDQSVRLDNRVIDLRTAANQGILRIQSAVCALFRECLLAQGFIEIHSPKMIATASEGGADVFRLKYFDRYAFLAQSPQLYKQMALMADLGRVFEIGPVFRSEKSLTHRHMTEFTGLDLEMTFNDDYHEVLDVIEGVFLHIFEGLNQRCKAEIEAVRAQYPFKDLRFSRPSLRMRFDEACTLLRTHGPAVGARQLAELQAQLQAAEAAGKDELAREVKQLVVDMEKHLATVPTHADDEDLSTRDEKLLGAVVGEVKGTDFYTIDKFPTSLRPFYTMADPDDPKWSNSYDIFIRGEEVTSGAQRIHDSDMLLANGARLGVDLKPIQDYVNSFKYGANPHAGGGIGLERVVMLFLQLDNIRKSSMFPRDPNRLTP